MRFADVDAVTIDAFGTLVELPDPTPTLVTLLRRRGIERQESIVRDAFDEEARYYREHTVDGRNARSLAELRRRCAEVFLAAARAEVDPAEFAPEYVAALRFGLVPGVEAALGKLAARGLELAVVSNWDVSLHDRLDELRLRRWFRTVVTSAEAGSAKPDPQIFLVALDRLGIGPERAVHVGDGEADAEGAAAAGLRFDRAPLAEAVARWS